MMVYVVLKNSDFTEGRGPMIFHKVFAQKDDAVSYIMTKDGVYGSKQGPSSYGNRYDRDCFNGYDIITCEMVDSFDAEKIKEKRDEIARLESLIELSKAEIRNLASDL